MKKFTLLHSNNYESKICLIIIKHLKLIDNINIINISNYKLLNLYIKQLPILVDTNKNLIIKQNIIEFIFLLYKNMNSEKPYSSISKYNTVNELYNINNNIITDNEEEITSKIEFEKNYQFILNNREI